MLSFLKSALSLCQLAFLNILMVQVKCCGSLMQLSNMSPLFIAAVLILLVGLVYTALLFSWQWLLYLPRMRIFKWSRNPKILTFIETYHTPYTPKHRYWTGLLLIVHIILYLVAAVDDSNNLTVALTAIICMVCCIFAFRLFFDNRLYQKWPVDILETFFYLNILLLATFTWYSLENLDNNQEAATYTSVILTLLYCCSSFSTMSTHTPLSSQWLRKQTVVE